MANFNGVNYARTISNPVVKIPPGEIKGQVLVAYDEYTSGANFTTADQILTGIVIPAGARVLRVTVVNFTNGGTLIVGIAGSTSKYGSFAAGASTAVPSLATPNTVDEALVIGASASATATGTYKICVEYVKV